MEQSWFAPPPTPNWFNAPAAPKPTRNPLLPISKEGRELMFVQFELVLPRVLDAIYAGSTLNNAIKSLRPLVEIDEGVFWRWLRKQPEFYAMYKDAVEARTEVWTGRILQRAEGVDENGEPTMNDVARDKLIVDQYKWLIQAQNRKEYGDVKKVEIDQQISIVGALDAARSRARTVAEVVDVDLLTDSQIRALPAPRDDDENEEEDDE